MTSWIIVAGICCNAQGEVQIVKADPALSNLPPLTQQACMETAFDLNKTFLAVSARTVVRCEPKEEGNNGIDRNVVGDSVDTSGDRQVERP